MSDQVTIPCHLLGGPACGTIKQIPLLAYEATILFVHRIEHRPGRYPVHRYEYRDQDNHAPPFTFRHVGIVGDVGNNEIVYAP